MTSAPEMKSTANQRHEDPIRSGAAATQNAPEAGEKATAAGAAGVEAVREMTRRATKQSSEAVTSGFRVVAGMQEPIADATFNQGRQVLSATARVASIYKEAAERTAEDVQALVTSYLQFGRGIQKLQHTYFDLLHQGFERARHKPQDLLRCASMTELAELQGAMYRDAVSATLEGSAKLFQLTAQVTQDAVQPLQERTRTRT